MELTDFLLARISEDQAAARAAPTDGALIWSDNGWVPPPWSKARVLAECESKRRIVELHEEALIERLDDEFPGDSCDALCGVDNDDFPCATLRLLALPYADHPDYDPTWAA
jgi:hypothetical protein